MRFMIVDTVYEAFLKALYQQPGLANRSFAEQQAAQAEGFFNSAGTWAAPLRALGHEVLDVTANNLTMQLCWMIENDLLGVAKNCADGLIFGQTIIRQRQETDWQLAFLAEQVKRFRPDVLLCANLYLCDDRFLTMVRGFYGKAVGQHAAPMPKSAFSLYDLIISALPSQAREFTDKGVRGEHLALAFDERVLPRLEERAPRHDAIFVGNITPLHRERARLLAGVARRLPIAFWGGADWPAEVDTAGLKIAAHPPIWGLEMYQLLKDSRIVLNSHVDVAGPHAANLRMYEVTGAGALLLTDNKSDMARYFEPGRECVTYDGPEDCADKLAALLAHPDEARAIAAAGHARTLREHTCTRRTDSLLALLA